MAGSDPVRAREVDSTADQVLREIRRIVRRISQHSKHLARESGLTVPRLLCLKAIGDLEDQDVTITVVGHHVQLSAATVSRIIDSLEKAGLVQRERTAKDRRKVRLTLTPAGYERYLTLPAPLQEEFVTRFMAIREEERRTLLNALQRVNDLMDSSDLDASPLLAPGTELRDSDPES